MTKESPGKRRRPHLLRSSTLVTCALFVVKPATACPLHSSGGGSSLLAAMFCESFDRYTEKKNAPNEFLSDDRKFRRRRRLQWRTTTIETPSPTFDPLESPLVVAPIYPAPSFAPWIGPSTPVSMPFSSQSAHGDREDKPSTSVVHIPVEPTTAGVVQPLVKFGAVPVGFDVLLETDSQQKLEEMAQQAKQILQDHLTTAIRQGFAYQEGVTLRSVDLNVKAFLTPPPRRSLLPQQIQRFVQLSRAITLEARGVAGFQVTRNVVDTDQFLAEVNTIIDESVEPESLMSIFQNSTYGLSDFRVASVTTTGQPLEEETSTPSLVEIIIAFVLIALMILSLGAYAYIFYRKRQKRLKRRRQFGVGHKAPSPYKGPPRHRPHGASITPTAAPGHIPASPSARPVFSPGVVNAASSESSYKGLGSESDDDDDADVFAKELRLAASLDRRAWDDFQQRPHQASNRQIIGAREDINPFYKSENGLYKALTKMDAAQEGIEMITGPSSYRPSEPFPSPPGVVGLTVMGDTVSIQSNNSFPYGDEHDPVEYKPPMYVSEAGVRKDLGSHVDYMESRDNGFEDLGHDETSGAWRMTKAAKSELNDRAKPTQSSPRPFSFLYHATESKLESQTATVDFPSTMEEENGNNSHLSAENISDPTSAGAFRGSPMSHSWSTNPRPGSSTENGTTAAVRGSPRNSPRHSPRASPQSSSWNTASRVVQDGSPSPSPAFGSTEAVNEEIAWAEVSEEESSFVAADIVKEVERLSQFVKTYERKKESRMKREHQLGNDFDLSHSRATRIGRDSLLETVTSLQNIVDPTPQGSNESAKKYTTPSRSLTSNHSISNSPERSLPRQIDGIESMQSSDSSDIHTMESDDLSRRLGITPFSVQKPIGYHNPAVQSSQRHPIAHISAAYYQRAASPREKEQNRNTGSHSSNKHVASQSALSALRNSGSAIFDGSMKEAPLDEFRPEVGTRQDNELTKNLRNPRTVTPRKRSSGNRGFDGIIDMFESKPQEPLYPPNESWQYNY